jgi:DNA polymerase-1
MNNYRLIDNSISLTPEILKIEKEVTSILDQMEEGFEVNLGALIYLDKTFGEILFNLRKEIEEKSRRPIRLNSNKELGRLLFLELGLPSPLRTPKRGSSVALSVLERLGDCYSDTCPFLKSLIEFKRLQPISKSVKTIFKKMNLNARIHPEFNQFGCPTGRIYSYIQNLPKEVRKVLIPDKEENVFIELDWSQQELRILGALSEEPVFLDCFAKGDDLHRRVISEMFSKPISEVTAEERKIGKTINYALIYGQEASGLAWNLNIPRKEAQELINRYFSTLPLIKKFKEECKARFLKDGYAETAFGRRTKLDLSGKNKARELRRGFNHIIQGTGADLLKFTLVRLSETLIGKKARLKFCAHDSIYLESEKDAAQEVGELAKSIIEIEFKGVFLPVTLKIHTDFSMGEG